MSTSTTVVMSTSTTSSVLSLSVRLCCSPLGGGAALGGTLPPGGGCRQLWAQGGQMVQRHQSCTHRHTRLSQHLSALDSTSSEPRLARLTHERKVSWMNLQHVADSFLGTICKSGFRAPSGVPVGGGGRCGPGRRPTSQSAREPLTLTTPAHRPAPR